MFEVTETHGGLLDRGHRQGCDARAAVRRHHDVHTLLAGGRARALPRERHRDAAGQASEGSVPLEHRRYRLAVPLHEHQADRLRLRLLRGLPFHAHLLRQHGHAQAALRRLPPGSERREVDPPPDPPRREGRHHPALPRPESVRRGGQAGSPLRGGVLLPDGDPQRVGPAYRPGRSHLEVDVQVHGLLQRLERSSAAAKLLRPAVALGCRLRGPRASSITAGRGPVSCPSPAVRARPRLGADHLREQGDPTAGEIPVRRASARGGRGPFPGASR
mmetsp:Transcript_15473/g.46446  ORF Transcript_15473/g.46446 Transcript_15473/m.46446 type:complete len:274 (+) Transcript_15473:445-1266(+)